MAAWWLCERAAKMIAFTRPPMSNQSVVSCDDVIFLPVCFVATGWYGYYDGGIKGFATIARLVRTITG